MKKIEKNNEVKLVSEIEGPRTLAPHYGILIADRAFVYAGLLTVTENFIYIDEGVNLHEWGSEYGLGKIAMEGAQEGSKFDLIPPTVYLRDGFAYGLMRITCPYKEVLKGVR